MAKAARTDTTNLESFLLRRRLETAVDKLIAALDALEDTDQDRGDDESEIGEDELEDDRSDNEPSLGSLENQHDQEIAWRAGSREDLELELGGAPDDSEYDPADQGEVEDYY